jgi:alanyl-tRNA synthetase
MAETQLKKEVRPLFEKNWKEHYQVDALLKLGYERKTCKTCKKPFWTNTNRDTCAESTCEERGFIGKKTKEYTYTQTWKEIEKFFKNKGHASIPRYPVIPRWRNDLYFTNASIIDFQPYVVNGEVKPPADPLIVPQTCIRFGDLTNVGVTGTHYTTFVMFGQHAFNTDPKKPYWKNEALSLDFEYLTKVIGVKEKDLVFFEDVWEGGGYFGPSMEYYAHGVELGNCVFMQYQDLGFKKYEQLKKPVIDMGAGFERLAWYTNGTPTSYDVTFKELLDYLKKYTKVKFDQKLLEGFYKLSGELNADEALDIEKKYDEISEKLGYSKKELLEKLAPVHALYAICDHTKTLLYTSTDGLLPSNSGGGYNLRILIRRVLDLNKEFDFNLDFAKIFEIHASSLKDFDPTLKNGLKTTIDVFLEEEKKYVLSKEKANQKINSFISSNKKLSTQDLITLYKSDGITAEQIKEACKTLKKEIDIPDDYLTKLTIDNKQEKENKDNFLEKLLEIENKEIIKALKNTEKLYYEGLTESTSKVIFASKQIVILDKTVFYPQGGGQNFDHGTINGIFDVKEVYNYEGKILHVLDNSKKELNVGQHVICLVDVDRQKQIKSQHTTTHLVNAAARKILGNHIWQAGAFKDVNEAHLDITHYKTITDKELKQIESLVNEWIFDAIPVKVYQLSKDEAEKKYGFRIYQGGAIPGNSLRILEIQGIDVQACAGLHLTNTSQAGLFKIIKRTSVQDGVERIIFTTYKSALSYISKNEEILESLTDLFSVSKIELEKTTFNFFKEWKEQRKEINSLRERIAEYETNNLILPKDKKVIAKFNLDSTEILKIFKKIQTIEKVKDKTIAIYNNNGNVFIMQGKDSKTTINEILKELEEKLKKKIKGGGSPFFQGKII